MVSEATVKVWEANGDRRPSPENLAGLERIFESSAPSADALSGDLASALQALTFELAAMRQERAVWAAWARGVAGAFRDYEGGQVSADLLDALMPPLPVETAG